MHSAVECGTINLSDHRREIAMTNETIQTIRSRRSCRAYKPEQITNEQLEAGLGAGT